MMKSLSQVVAFIAILAACGLVTIVASVPCDANVACFPWNTGAGPSCTRGANLNLRFFMNATNEYPEENRTMTFAFCPRVDELQAFNLSHAPRYAALSRTNTEAPTFVENVQDAHISVFGFGNYDSRLQPSNSSVSRVMILHNETEVRVCPIDEVLFVDFLVFQVSLTSGMLTYTDAKSYGSTVVNETTNETSAPYSTDTPPQGTGFQPTCSSGVCTMDGSMQCIGENVENQNCARCYKAADLYNRTTMVWVAYYGTDVNKRRLLSGSSNPLNFRKFSGGSIYQSLTGSVNKVSSGEALDPTGTNDF